MSKAIQQAYKQIINQVNIFYFKIYTGFLSFMVLSINFFLMLQLCSSHDM